jgi:mannitol-1-phosphate 5-dehydrogenase
MIDNNQILIFGAGKIGSSFIGQLFGCAGYEVVFVDVSQPIIDGLNARKSYRVIIKGDQQEEIIVPRVRAISAFEKEAVYDAISTAGLMAVSVGKNTLATILPDVANGLVRRTQINPGVPLDIILAENMRSAAKFVRKILNQNLPSDFAVDELAGLVETSIGKMVPIIPQAELDKDPLVVFAEPYNTLIVDRKGFRNPVPEIPGLAPKDNIKAWVDRKAFIHNLGHATAAYYGHFLHPEAVYMYEVLDDEEVFHFTRAVMLQSADILRATYPEEYTASDLEAHIDDLIDRFRNKALGDTIFRVGQDLTRKLGPDDRFMGAIHLAIKHNKPYSLILKAMSFGLLFRAPDETGKSLKKDVDFLDEIGRDFENTFIHNLGFDPKVDKYLIQELKKDFNAKIQMITNRKNQKE